MKITIKPKQVEENHEIPFDEIPVGYVYVVEHHSGPIALKLNNNEAVLLSYGGGNNWFILATGYKGKSAYKVLGKLAEIIVEEV